MLTWKWFVKHELITIVLLLFLLGLGWVLLDEGIEHVAADMPAQIK
jgi:hypothetical protein